MNIPDHTDVVRAVKAQLEAAGVPVSDGQPEHLAQLCAHVAWQLRDEGCGLLDKPAGDNIAPYHGRMISCSRVCYPDGTLRKIVSDAGPGGANGAGWGDDGTVDASRYIAATQPDDLVAPAPTPDPAPAPAPAPADDEFAIICAKLDDIRKKQDDAEAAIIDSITKLRNDALAAAKQYGPLLAGGNAIADLFGKKSS